MNIFRRRSKNGRHTSFKESLRNRTRQLAVLFAYVAALSVIALSLFFLHARSTLPDPEAIISRQVKESTKIYDLTGETLLYDIYDEERRTVVPFDDISQNIKDATIAIEDANFYQHRGIDLQGIFRSVIQNIRTGDIRGAGGSTLTQQLIGNALVGRQKTYRRKIQEAILSIEVERRFTKDQILWMYLNQVPYGSNAYGVEAASQTFFGIPASELSVAQSAVLAALVQRPSYLSPYGYHQDDMTARKETVIGRMRDLGFLSAEEYESALAEELEFKPPTRELAAPHFVIMAREYAINKYGEDIIESGGFRIITTLDAELQNKADELVARYAEINVSKVGATNASLVAIDPETGRVRALVGSANYFDIENEGNFNVATAKRQPGSSFKPFAYAAAFQQGYPDTTIVWDTPTEFDPGCTPDTTRVRNGRGGKCYHPRNYDGSYSGAVTLRQSLARSLNVTSVKTLYLAGIENTINLAERLGITTLGDRSRFGLSLVLGGAEVRLVDIVSAYGVFANDGIRNPWTLIERIELADGTILEERSDQPIRAIDAQTSRMVTNILSDNISRAPTFGLDSPLQLGSRPVAAKTGTTQENRDAWTIGYTPQLAVGVWVGNNDNTSMNHFGTGAGAAAPLWNAFMRTALAGEPIKHFPNPDPVFSDKTMLDGSPVSSQFPEPHTILFYVDRNNPLGARPGNPANDSVYLNWEWAVRRRAGLL